jgi:hypothetical protein
MAQLALFIISPGVNSKDSVHKICARLAKTFESVWNGEVPLSSQPEHIFYSQGLLSYCYSTSNSHSGPSVHYQISKN